MNRFDPEAYSAVIKNYLDQILKDGAVKAEDISSKKVKKIKEIVGF